MRSHNYAERDRPGKVSFYVLLWKRQGITVELFDDPFRHGNILCFS
ncbi:hypothetical protein H6G41_23760 [Tolypothrix sp. FACHB-123]|nr:hypothetical protein [Tolypothrix sp. FACHB-123]MBD2357592.1 hypothetical protein [Tolypothrix sp. FACHB-123]